MQITLDIIAMSRSNEVESGVLFIGREASRARHADVQLEAIERQDDLPLGLWIGQTPHHTAMVPPSSTMVVLVIYDTSSQARNTVALPTSAGRLSRRNGVRAISWARLSSVPNA
jgi:hypothetical protein